MNARGILFAVTLCLAACASPGYVNVKPTKDLADPTVKPRVIFTPDESVSVAVGGGEFTGHKIAVVVKNAKGESIYRSKEAPLADGQHRNSASANSSPVNTPCTSSSMARNAVSPRSPSQSPDCALRASSSLRCGDFPHHKAPAQKTRTTENPTPRSVRNRVFWLLGRLLWLPVLGSHPCGALSSDNVRTLAASADPTQGDFALQLIPREAVALATHLSERLLPVAVLQVAIQRANACPIERAAR